MKEKITFPADKRFWSPSPLLGQVVLVTTLNEDGQSNLAPKSWISMMAFEPPVIALGCNLEHWTAINILRTHEFVINIPGAELVERVWICSALPHPRPVEATGLTPIPPRRVKPPLIEECKAHLECVLLNHVTFGMEIVFFGEIVASSIDQEVLAIHDPYSLLRPIVYLENGKFGIVENARLIGSPPKS